MTISSLSYDVLPDDYQNEDVGRIFNILESGESLTLLAVGSAGKSNLLHFIMEDRIKEKYLGAKSAPHYIMLMINAHNLVTLEGEALQQAGKRWTGYELMLFRLYNELAHVYKHKAFEGDEQKKTAIFRTYEQVEQFYGYLFGPSRFSSRRTCAIWNVLSSKSLAWVTSGESFFTCLMNWTSGSRYYPSSFSNRCAACAMRISVA